MCKRHTSLLIFEILESRNEAIRLFCPCNHVERHLIKNSWVVAADDLWIDPLAACHLSVHGKQQRRVVANVVDREVKVEIDGEDVCFCFKQLQHHALIEYYSYLDFYGILLHLYYISEQLWIIILLQQKPWKIKYRLFLIFITLWFLNIGNLFRLNSIWRYVFLEKLTNIIIFLYSTQNLGHKDSNLVLLHGGDWIMSQIPLLFIPVVIMVASMMQRSPAIAVKSIHIRLCSNEMQRETSMSSSSAENQRRLAGRSNRVHIDTIRNQIKQLILVPSLKVCLSFWDSIICDYELRNLKANKPRQVSKSRMWPSKVIFGRRGRLKPSVPFSSSISWMWCQRSIETFRDFRD